MKKAIFVVGGLVTMGLWTASPVEAQAPSTRRYGVESALHAAYLTTASGTGLTLSAL